MLRGKMGFTSRFQISTPGARVSYLLSDSIDSCSPCSIVRLEREVSIKILHGQESRE